MIFNFPKKRINDTAWFINGSELLVFGMIKLITLAISEDECKTYYRFIDEDEVEHTVSEAQVLDNQLVIPTPKFAVGDGVVYNKQLEGGKTQETVDVIKMVQLSLYDKGAIEITYTMCNDPDEWVFEHEIVAHGEPVINMVREDEENTVYTAYGRADV